MAFNEKMTSFFENIYFIDEHILFNLKINFNLKENETVLGYI